VNRDVSISYGGLTIGGSSTAYRLDGPFAFEIGRDTISLEANVIVKGTSEATLLSNEAALLNVFNKPKGTLVVMLGASTRYTFSHAANTGMNAQARANKAGSALDSGYACRYTVSVVMERPWDFSGDNGLRSASISCQTGTNDLRTLVVSGQYSATSGNTAKANHDSNVATLCSAWLSTYSILQSDLIEKLENPDKENKNYDFRRTFVEVGFAKNTSGTNPTTFKNPTLSAFFNQEEFGSFAEESRKPIQGTITYSALVLFPSTINLAAPQDLKAFITANLDPKVLDYLRRVTPVDGPICIVSRKPTYEPFTNTISVTYEVLVYPSRLVEQNVAVEEDCDEGITLTPVWDGQMYSRVEQPAPRSWNKQVVITQAVIGEPTPYDIVSKTAEDAVTSSAMRILPEWPFFSEFRKVGAKRTRARSYIGVLGATRIRVTFETWVFMYTRVQQPTTVGKGAQQAVPSGILRDGGGGGDAGGAQPSAPGDVLTNRSVTGG
jgi:hypothetical protein